MGFVGVSPSGSIPASFGVEERSTGPFHAESGFEAPFRRRKEQVISFTCVRFEGRGVSEAKAEDAVSPGVAEPEAPWHWFTSLVAGLQDLLGRL